MEGIDLFRVFIAEAFDVVQFFPAVMPERDGLDTFLHVYQKLPYYISRLNQEYIQRELTNNKSFFDSIRGKSLDLQQRLVCVTDDDYTLVVAGAGSGKTVTIEAKVKYLVEKKGVDPKEILVTSFTDKTVDELKVAYNEMLNGSLTHKDKWEWYAIWMIELKDGTHIGEFCFKGISKDGIAEIGYGIVDNYQGNGYATETVSALVDWALKQTGVSCIKAETESSYPELLFGRKVFFAHPSREEVEDYVRQMVKIFRALPFRKMEGYFYPYDKSYFREIPQGKTPLASIPVDFGTVLNSDLIEIKEPVYDDEKKKIYNVSIKLFVCQSIGFDTQI